MRWNQLFLGTSLTMLGVIACAQSPTTDGSYTEAQAANGKKSYDQHCSACHLLTLRGSAHGPELTGPNFTVAWGTRTTAEMFAYNSDTMPPGTSDSLGESIHVDIIAHV